MKKKINYDSIWNYYKDRFVLNRGATAEIDALSSINMKNNGRSFSSTGISFAQDGGLVSPDVSTDVEGQVEFQSNLVDAVAQIRPRVIVEDIRDGINDEVEVETIATQ